MRLAKVFKTSEIPDEFWNDFPTLYNHDNISVPNGFGYHDVGQFVKEAREASIHFSTLALISLDFDPEEVAFVARFDKWLIDNGAVNGERIIIDHS